MKHVCSIWGWKHFWMLLRAGKTCAFFFFNLLYDRNTQLLIFLQRCVVRTWDTPSSLCVGICEQPGLLPVVALLKTSTLPLRNIGSSATKTPKHWSWTWEKEKLWGEGGHLWGYMILMQTWRAYAIMKLRQSVFILSGNSGSILDRPGFENQSLGQLT